LKILKRSLEKSLEEMMMYVRSVYVMNKVVNNVRNVSNVSNVLIVNNVHIVLNV
jgi:hypothetical protein